MRQASFQLRLCLFLSLLLCIGCSTAAHPRSGYVAEPGGVAFDMFMPITTVGQGRATGTIAEPDVEPDPNQPPPAFVPGQPIAIEGNSGALLIGHPLLYVMPSWWELNLRFGVVEPCELGGTAGWIRVGGEVRCGLMQERWDQPLSVAVSTGIGWHPFFQKDEPWYRGGIDVSRNVGWSELIVGAYLSYGPEERGLTGVPSGLDRMEDLHVGPSVQVSSRELKLSTPVGMRIFGETETIGFLVGLVPRFDLRHDDLEIECRQCGADLVEFEEKWAVTLVAGVSFESREDVISGIDWSLPEPDSPPTPPPGHHVEWSPDPGLLGGGLSTIATGYMVMVFPLVLNDEVEVPLSTYIPVVGPWLIASADQDEIGGDGIAFVVGIISGVLQGVGALLGSTAFIFPEYTVVADAPQPRSSQRGPPPAVRATTTTVHSISW